MPAVDVDGLTFTCGRFGRTGPAPRELLATRMAGRDRECYSPKLNERFWILPENVRACGIPRDECPTVPREFHYMTDFEYEMRGRELSQR